MPLSSALSDLLALAPNATGGPVGGSVPKGCFSGKSRHCGLPQECGIGPVSVRDRPPRPTFPRRPRTEDSAADAECLWARRVCRNRPVRDGFSARRMLLRGAKSPLSLPRRERLWRRNFERGAGGPEGFPALPQFKESSHESLKPPGSAKTADRSKRFVRKWTSGPDGSSVRR